MARHFPELMLLQNPSSGAQSLHASLLSLSIWETDHRVQSDPQLPVLSLTLEHSFNIIIDAQEKGERKKKSTRMSPCPPRRHAEQTFVPQPRPTPPGRHPDPDEVRPPLWIQYPPAHLPSTDPDAQATSSFICRSLWAAGCPRCTQVEHRARRAVGSQADRPLGIGTAGEFYKTHVKPLACARAVSRGPGRHQEQGCVSLPGPVPRELTAQQGRQTGPREASQLSGRAERWRRAPHTETVQGGDLRGPESPL